MSWTTDSCSVTIFLSNIHDILVGVFIWGKDFFTELKVNSNPTVIAESDQSLSRIGFESDRIPIYGYHDQFYSAYIWVQIQGLPVGYSRRLSSRMGYFHKSSFRENTVLVFNPFWHLNYALTHSYVETAELTQSGPTTLGNMQITHSDFGELRPIGQRNLCHQIGLSETIPTI